MKAYKVNTTEIICTSPNSVGYAGGNGNGGPTTAESKRSNFFDNDWDWD